MNRAIVLYGPPASGKNTITTMLTQISNMYLHFQRVKYGTGRTSGYRMVTKRRLEAIRSEPGEVLWENDRYGSIYIVDRSHLLALTQAHKVPVVHLGQVEAVDAVTTSVPVLAWLVVELKCPRNVAAERIAQRGTGDTAARLEAFDLTAPLPNPDLTIDTSVASPAEAAIRIDRHWFG